MCVRVGTAGTGTRAAGPTGDKGQSSTGAVGAALGHVPLPWAVSLVLAQGWVLWKCSGREESRG